MESSDEESASVGSSAANSSISDDNESTMSAGSNSSSSSFAFDPYNHYVRIFSNLHSNTERVFVVRHSQVQEYILDDVDEFAEALSNNTQLESVWLGNKEFYKGKKLELTSENESSWNTFCEALGTLESVEELEIGAMNLSGAIMAKIVQSLPGVRRIRLFLPFISLSGDMSMLAKALSEHQCQDIVLSMKPELFEHDEEHTAFLAGGVPNHFADGGIASQLFRVDGLDQVFLKNIVFGVSECQAFADILSSDEGISAERLYIDNCSFSDGCGQLVAHGLSANSSLKHVHLINLFEEKTFCEELVSSLPLNTSIHGLVVRCDVRHVGLLRFSIDLAKSIATKTKTLKILAISSVDGTRALSALTSFQRNDLEHAFRGNYSLEFVNFFLWTVAPMVTRLNKAGRRYLVDDSTSKSKCIAVLAKVKHDIDCLYYHLRENPLICLVDADCDDASSASGNHKTDGPVDISGKGKRLN